MAETLVLPLRPDLTNYTISTQLAGVTFVFDFVWNYRAVAWFMSIKSADGTALLDGKKVVTGASLNNQLITNGPMVGLLQVIDTEGAGGSPGIDDFGTRFLLMYTDEA